MEATEHVPHRVVGIDLAGVRSKTTGWAEATIEGGIAAVSAVGVLPQARTPLAGESLIRQRLQHLAPGDVVVIDAPLTLPPALRDGSLGVDGNGGSEFVQAMWAEGWHPVTARECEFLLVKAGHSRPLNTMQIGMIAARAIVLARDLRALGLTVLEAYPRAVRPWLQQQAAESTWEGGYEGLADALRTTGLLTFAPTIDLNAVEPDALDASLCVLVGIAYLRGETVPPPEGLDEERDGWIRVPVVSRESSG